MRTEDLAFKPIQWAQVASAVNATVTATQTGVTGKQHAICGISVSASSQPASAVQVQILNGATVLDQWEVPAAAFTPILHNYARPFLCTAGNDAIVTVSAMGAGVRCTAVLKGFSGMAG